MAKDDKGGSSSQSKNGPVTTTSRTDSSGVTHTSQQGPTQSGGGWGRTSTDTQSDGARTNVHVTTVDSSGHKSITNIPTTNASVSDLAPGPHKK